MVQMMMENFRGGIDLKMLFDSGIKGAFFSIHTSYYYRVLWYFVGEILFCLFGWAVHDSKGWCFFASNINDFLLDLPPSFSIASSSR